MSCELEFDGISSKATTAEHLRRLYEGLARETEADRSLWQAVVLAGAMDRVRSPEVRGSEGLVVGLRQEILAQGRKRGEITRAFSVVHLAEFMEALYHTVLRKWAVDLTGPHKLTERVRSAVEFLLRGVPAVTVVFPHGDLPSLGFFEAK